MTSFFLRRGSAAALAALGRGVARLEAWVRGPVDEAGDDEARYRAFNTWYFSQLHQQERMLADGPRVDFYYELICARVRPGDRMIDLGTGTGVLAAWASRQGAAKVWALDHSAILEHAKTLAEANGIERVEFVATHSTDFTLPEQVDVIVHEQMGDFLFDESMVRNVCDLRDRLLAPGGRILPSAFELYCEPVKLRDDRHVPFIWELNVHGFDYACMEKHRPQEDEYYRIASCDEAMVEAFTSVPEPVLSFDLHTIDERTFIHEIAYQRTAREAGRVDALAVYFRVKGENGKALTTSPLEAGRSPHWGFRLLRLESRPLRAGDVLDLTLEAGAWADSDSWRWSCEVRPAATTAEIT